MHLKLAARGYIVLTPSRHNGGTDMSRRCDLTGRSPSFGYNVSFSKRRTNRRWLPNVQKWRIWVPEEQRFVRLKLSAAALREIERKGLLQALRDRGLTLKDVERRSRA